MEKMSWPSERIAHGGIFHQRNVNYSRETNDMIKTLMSEANLTMMQRNKINYFLRQGSALPQLEMQKRRLPSQEYELRRAREIMDRSRVVRKRSWETIAKSGVFEIERYVPKVTTRNNDKAKQQLQERMSGLKEYPELDRFTLHTKEKHRKNGKIYSNDRVAELLKEIYERIEWIKEMDELGEGKKHRQVIDAQVTERLREIKRIEEKLGKQKRDGLQDVTEED
ncbi:unnamed protein product [Chironomus riparius]|uniref:Uncharacterized protein n=1 Tax=Chironomus riparius TaxID=315576 RepID=A0A9N9S4N3_9DIPT|nr:unnamed protein product [Chironomus riparius]